VAAGEVDKKNALPLRLVVLLAVAHLSFAGARLALTLQAVHLNASPFSVGLLMSLLMVVPMFVAVPIGRWADRSGFMAPAVLGFAMLSVAGLLAASLPTLAALGVASVLVGSGYMLAHVSVNNAIGVASTPGTRSQAFGMMAMAFSVSGLVGPMLAGFAIDYGNHAVAFAVLAVFPLLSALLLVIPQRLPNARSAAPAAAQRSGVLDLLRHPPLRAVFIVSGLVSMGWDLFTFLVPLHGVRIGLSASAIGLVVGAFGAGSFTVRLAIPWLMRAFDEWIVLGAALALTAVCYVAFPFCESLSTLLPLSFVLGMVLGCGQPLGMSLVHVTAPPSRSGEAVGVRSTITSISQTVLPLLFGGLGTAVGMVPVFWAAATVLASGSAYAAKRRPR
jgi:MFS family permease